LRIELKACNSNKAVKARLNDSLHALKSCLSTSENPQSSILNPQSLKISLKLSIFILAAFTFIQAQKRADILVLADPLNFTILNRYEQPLSEREKESFLPYAPLQIKEKETVLGDEITPALTFLFNGSSWYLLKDEKGDFIIHQREGGDYRILKNCQIIGDTIQITRSRAVKFAAGYPGQEGGSSLDKDEILFRLFKYKNRYCLKQTAGKGPFGWSTLANHSAWQRLKMSVQREEKTLNPAVIDRLSGRMRAANSMYKKYFSAFNNITRAGKTAPQWKKRTLENGIRFALSGPESSVKQLEESTRYLVRDLENILIGKPFSVNSTEGEITIVYKGE